MAAIEGRTFNACQQVEQFMHCMFTLQPHDFQKTEHARH
jgi:hypothetical protein